MENLIIYGKENKDPRTLRTRRALKDALITLIEEKDFNDIKVQHITEKAIINRITFYNHYKDKYQLLDSCLIEWYEEEFFDFHQALGNRKIDMEEFRKIIVSTIEFFSKYSKYFRLLTDGNSYSYSSSSFYQYFEYLFSLWMESIAINEEKVLIDKDFLSKFYCAAYINSVFSWLEDDQKITANELADKLMTTTSLGMYASLGVAISNDEVKVRG